MDTTQYDVLLGARAIGDPVQARPETRVVPDAAKLSEELFLQYQSLSLPWRKQVVEDRDFVYISQWDDKKSRLVKRRRQTPLTIDCCSPAMEQAVAMLTSNAPKFSSTGREDSDTKKGRMFAEVLSYVQDINNGTAKLKVTVRDAYVSSIGWMVYYWDPNANFGRGEIAFKTVDPLSVFVDPAASEMFFDNAPHVIIAEVATSEQLVAENPDYAGLIDIAEPYAGDVKPTSSRTSAVASGSTNRAQPIQLKRFLKLDRYSRIKHRVMFLNDPKTGYEKLVEIEDVEKAMDAPAFIRRTKMGDEYFVDPDSIRDAQKTIGELTEVFHLVLMQDGSTTYAPGTEEEAPPEGGQNVPGTTTYIIQTTVEEVIALGGARFTEILVDRIKRVYTIGNVLAYEGVIPTTNYPLVPLMFNYDRGPYPVSSIRRVKGIQEYINDMTTLIVAHMEKTTNFKVGYVRGMYNEQDLNAMWSDPSKTFIPMEPEGGALVPLSPAPPPNEVYKNLAEAKADIERILGIYALQQGDPSGAPNTYRGMLALEEFGQRRVKSQKDDIESFLNRCARVMIELIQYYYTDFRVVRLLRPNGKQVRIGLNTSRVNYDDVTYDEENAITDISVGKYDIIVVSGSTLPSNRWALLENYKELAKMGIIDQEEVLKKTDVADVEGVLERTSIIKQQAQMIQQLQGQIKQLNGDLQTAQREEIHAKKQLAVKDFEVVVDKSKNRVEGATELFAQGMRMEGQSRKRNRRKEK
jgi:hypothetical protein